MELTSLIQFICIQKRRVGLSLSNGSEHGYILFDNGDVVHAETEGVEGEDAILRLLDWEDGRFSTNNDAPVTRRTINTPWDRMLMEAMVKLDELECDDYEDEFDSPREFTEEEITQDTILEDKIMLLLWQLEEEQTKIKFGKVKGASAVLDSLVNMANIVLDFFEKIAANHKRSAELKKDCSKYISRYPMTRSLLTSVGNLSNISAAEIYTSANIAQREQVFADICLTLTGVMDSAFKVVISCFNSKDAAKEIDEAYNLFLRDLNDTVGQLNI